MITRHLIALGAFLAAAIVTDRALAFLLAIILSGVDFSQNIDYWVQATLNIDAVRYALVCLVAFSIGAYLLRENVLVPGLVVLLGFVVRDFFLWREYASSFDAPLTYFEAFTDSLGMWVGVFVSALTGLAVGRYTAQRRQLHADAL